jgi:hypothetical protein
MNDGYEPNRLTEAQKKRAEENWESLRRDKISAYGCSGFKSINREKLLKDLEECEQ